MTVRSGKCSSSPVINYFPFYCILCTGSTAITKDSFTSSNSSFSECVRKHSFSSSSFSSINDIINKYCPYYNGD